ncbi:MAG TPA: hypothetical protein VNE39_05825 [Planctomycetota bacterium]|nr:hypothetical protein [Planctomycetota bacterium]
MKDANFKQDQQHGENLIRNYQQANNAFIEMASQRKPANQTMDKYLAAHAETLAKTREGRALTDAMAQVEFSYTAKMGFQSPTVTKVRHAMAKGTREGQAEAFHSTRKELETKIIKDLPDGSSDKAYFEKALTIAKEGATDPHAAMQKLQSFTGGDIRDLAVQVKQQLIHMITTAPR